MNPSFKTEKMSNLIEKCYESIGLGERKDSIVKNKCVGCFNDVDPSGFKDKTSKVEYSISGLCQRCQDKVFCKRCDVCGAEIVENVELEVKVKSSDDHYLDYKICTDCYDDGFCENCKDYSSSLAFSGICDECKKRKAKIDA